MPSFKITASGMNARITEEVDRSLRGESQPEALDARGIQPFLTYRLSRTVNAGLSHRPEGRRGRIDRRLISLRLPSIL